MVKGGGGAFIEKRKLTHTVRQNVPHILRRGKDRAVRLECDGGSALAGRVQLGKRLDGISAVELDAVGETVAAHFDQHPVGKRIHAGNADAVKSA